MAKKKKSNKKPIKASRPAAPAAKPVARKTAKPVVAKSATKAKVVKDVRPMTFSQTSILWIAGGFGIMIIGMLLMTGGEMPSNDVWDENIIYSFRRITLAPIVILGGLGVVIYALMKK